MKAVTGVNASSMPVCRSSPEACPRHALMLRLVLHVPQSQKCCRALSGNFHCTTPTKLGTSCKIRAILRIDSRHVKLLSC